MSDRDERVDEIIAEYLDAERDGRADPPDEVIARHPEYADELRAFFADRARFVRIAGGPAVVDPRAETVGLATRPAPGDRLAYFGDYELLAEIARGGMGVVYKARQSGLNRTVALKLILSGQFASRTDVERFRREAEAVANLDHPNIVPVYEVGEHEGQQYFSMKLVEGGSLQERLAEFRKNPARAARLVATVARAVEHAHRRGVIHRDLKPGNVLLDAAGEPMVADFGLAKRVEGAEAVTRTGAVVGTPAYMAPEQAAGGKDVTTAADVYGLGAILYECLTGRPPFPAETQLEALVQLLNREPDRPRAIDPAVPRDLETVCLKCLEKDPARRYHSAAALADDLERWLRGEPIAARPVGPAGRAWRWCRRNPAVAALTAAVAVALVAGTGVSAIFALQARESARDARAARDAAERKADAEFVARQETQQALDRAADLLYANQIALAHREWEGNNLGQFAYLLDVAEEKRRGWEWHYLRRLRDLGRSLSGHQESVEDMAFAPDGRYLAAVGGDGRTARPHFTRIWDTRTGQPVATYEGRGGAAVAYRPDLGLVATPGREGVLLWNPATGKDVRELKFEGRFEYRNRKGELVPVSFLGGRIEHLACSPDGKLVAAAGSGKVLVWSVADGNVVFASVGGGGVAFSPDGKHLASGTDSEAAKAAPDNDDTPTVYVWNTASWKAFPIRHDRAVRQVAFGSNGLLACADVANVVTVWDVGSQREAARELATIRPPGVADFAFSPDGARLATAGRFDGRVTVWDARTGEKLYALPSAGRLATAVAFSADGETLAAASGARRDPGLSVRLWPGRAAEVTTFRGHDAGVWSAAFLPDGERVVSAGGTSFDRPGQVLLWNAKTGRQIRSFTGHTSIVFCAAVSPDGKVLATGSADKTVRLWDIDTGRELTALTGHQGNVTGVAFSPDGRRLVSVGVRAALNEKIPPGEVRLWEVSGGRPVAALEGVKGQVQSVAFRPDGDEFAVAATEIDAAAQQMTGVVTLHAASDGRVQRTVRLDPMTRITDIDYRPGSRRLTVVVLPAHRELGWGANLTPVVREYDPETDRWRDLIWTIPNGPMSVAYSPDGRRLATGNLDGSVKVWDATSGYPRELLTFGGQGLPLGHVTFSPDGSRLALAGGDSKTVRVWDGTAK